MTNTPDKMGVLRWAVRGKHAGQLDDYEILADDGDGARRDEYAGIMRDLIAGNPSNAPAGAPDALPWAAFAAFKSKSHGDRLAFTVLEWPPETVRDSTGRRATRCRYFDVDFAHVCSVGAAYTDLYAGLDALGVPARVLGVPVIPPADLKRLADFIDSAGDGWLPAAAAALLDGPVVLIGEALPVRIAQRLLVLDAIAALLPYGYRADLPVATWAPNRARHHLRLFFSDFVAQNQRAIRYGTSEAVSLYSDLSRDYHDRLTRLKRTLGTHRLLQELWTDRRVCRFDGTVSILDTVERLDRPYAIALAARRGEPVLGRIRDVLADGGYPAIDDQTLVALAQYLVDHGVDSDLRLLARYWGEAVSRLVVGLFVTAGAHSRAQMCAQTAHDAEQLPAFLHDVVAAAAQRPECQRNAARMLASIIPPKVSPRLTAAVRTVPQLAALIVIQGFLLRSSGPQWLGVITHQGGDATPAWVKPFAEIGSDGLPLTKESVEPLLSQDGTVALALLTAALYGGRANRVLLSAAAWGALARRLHGTADKHLAEDFMEVRSVHAILPPEQRAALDLLAMLAGRSLSDFPAEQLAANELRSYLDGVRSRFAYLAERGVKDCMARFVEVAAAGGGITAERLDFLLKVARLITVRAAIDDAYRRVGDVAASNLSCLDGQQRSVIQLLSEHSLELRQTLRGKEIALAAARAAVPSEELTELCLVAVADGLPVESVFAELRRWKGMTQPQEVFLLIEAIGEQVRLRGPGRREAAFEAGIRFMQSGMCGELATVQWRRWFARHIEDMEQDVKWFKSLVKPSKPGIVRRLVSRKGEE